VSAEIHRKTGVLSTAPSASGGRGFHGATEGDIYAQLARPSPHLVDCEDDVPGIVS